MPSVGVLAAIVNVVVILTVAVVDRVIELVVRNFAASRLRKEKRAPVVHDSDTWLPNIPRSVVKYHKHPAILLTVICSIFLVCSELVTELGVDVSNKCSPVKKNSTVITRGDSSGSFTDVELGTSAFFLQTITFLDGDLTRVPSGLPRSIKGNECIDCMTKEEYPDILSGCSIADERVYKPGELSVSILTTNGAFKTITSQMKEIGGSQREFKGRGDLTNNGVHWAAFMVTESGEYLEYSDQKHLPQLVNTTRNNQGKATPGAIESNVIKKKITCGKNVLSGANLMNAVSIYRTIQLENTINPATFFLKNGSFKSISPNDIYRAALSVKIIDDALTTGYYFEYTTCGNYKWQFLIPITACVTVIFLLFALSVALGTGLIASQIPYNSRSWFSHSHVDRGGGSKNFGNLARAKSGYFDSIFDEMVVIEDGRGPGKAVKIGLRSRDGRISPLTPGAQNLGFTGDYSSDMQLANEMDAPGNVVVTKEVEMPEASSNEANRSNDDEYP